jgi:transcriptional regulator with XRE-family HTH domain
MSVFADRLKSSRENLGLTQVGFSAMAGLGEQQIYRYENDKTRPKVDDLTAIARQLNVSVDYLLGLTDTPRRVILSIEEIELLDAWKRGDMYFVLDHFRNKIKEYSDSHPAVAGV